jgi:ABC-type antimicrobial peptide transport system permease subunit
MTIVGVVEDAAQYSFRQPPLMTVYTPLTQLAEPESLVTVALRSRDPAALRQSIRSEVRSFTPDVVVDYVRTMEEQVDAALVRERLLAMLSSAFGLLALVLSCIGLYGVVSYDVTRRRREIGIRMALGARRADVLRQILGGAVAICCVGVLAGLMVAVAGTRFLASLLFEVAPRDPLTLAVAATMIVATTVMASYLPARRASALDPALVLRTE